MANPTNSSLERSIGAKTLAINAINLTIGAGIFVLPANVAGYLGPASFIAFIGCGILIGIIMLCFAEMGSRVTTSGGAYAYVEHAFGPLAGFITNLLLWIGWAVLADAALLNAMTDMISIGLPVFKNFWLRALFFLFVLGLFSYINIKGVKSGARMVVILTTLKLTPLILLIIIGAFYVKWDNLVVESWPSRNALGSAMLILFFAFLGTESALNNSGEIKNPRKSIPKGIFLGVIGILIVYMQIQFVSTGILGDELASFKEAPLAATAERIIGPIGGGIMLITAIVSIYGTIGGDILASSRLPFAAAKDGLLPKPLSKVHPRFHTPYVSILVFSALIFLTSISGGFETLAILASSFILIVYLGVVLAVIKCRIDDRKKSYKVDFFKVPWGYLIPILGVIIITWVLSYTKPVEFLALIVFIAITILFYFGFQYYNKPKSDK